MRRFEAAGSFNEEEHASRKHFSAFVG